MSKLFEADRFTPTRFSTAADKAKFANKFAKFLLDGCPRKAFAKWFYTELSNCFGHIAHFDINGFYAEWFSDADSIARFVEHTRRHTPLGPVDSCFVDVEREIQSWLAFPDVALKIDSVIATRRKAEREAAEAEAARREALAQATSQEFKVAAKSSNTGSFGHYQYVLVARDGSAYKVQIIPSNLTLDRGQVITVPLKDGRPDWTRFYVECPQRCPDCPPEVVKEVWAA